MPDDPIERLSADIEIFAIPQAPGMPPLADAVLHVRRRQDGAAGRARLGLPAYQGRPGPAGPPGAVHQGERTTAQLEALRTVLDKSNTNWAYRNTQTNDQWVWTGETFIVYHGVYGTPGPPGPAPTLAPGTLTVGGEHVDAEFGIRLGGSAGAYTLGLDLPPSPKGDPGDPGPSGSIFDSVDVEGSPADGDGLAYVEGTGKLEWRPVGMGVHEWVVPPSGFTTTSVGTSGTRIDILVLSLPARPWPYRLDITGDVDVDCPLGTQIDIEVRKGSTSGELVGIGRSGAAGAGWRPVTIRTHSEVSITPESTAGIQVADTPVDLYLSAVRRAGSSGWGVRSDRAQLRVRMQRLP